MSMAGEITAQVRGDDLRREWAGRGVRFCPHCGLGLSSEGVCSYHLVAESEQWAAGNRVWCDFFHRGVVPARVRWQDQQDEFWRKLFEVRIA
jgi:hypothetical protein